MSEEIKKTEQIEPEAKEPELSDKDLEQVAGGAATNQSGAAHKATQSMIKFAGS